ncbi:MAG: hypothetical protein HYS06_09420 [Methylocystis sp.]|nr:hypothetical protein [Methylocystis sp.]
MLSQIDKQIVRSWYNYLVEPRLAKLTGRVLHATGPRIAVVGNCQSFGVAYAMKLLDPSASVDQYSAIAKSRANIALLAKTLATYDYVFSQEFPPSYVRGGGSAELCALLGKTTLFPAVAFAAFHPDLVFLLDATRNYAATFGPIGPYHSALAAFAFRKGLSLQEANALFNRNVYEALGYFNFWNAAADELLETSKRRFGMDLSAELVNWARRGVFMYSVLHPKPFVLFDIARKLFAQAKLRVPDVDFDFYAIDDLARGYMFPVYPAIGEHFGRRGGYMFKLNNFHLSQCVGDFLTLPQFLAASYKVYQRSKNAQLANPRVDGWLADAAASDMIVRLARENLKAGLLPVL